MPRAKKPTVASEQVPGLKYLRRITKLLHRLHDDATARDKAHNRTLFYDQYASLVLIAMFSPAARAATAMSAVKSFISGYGSQDAVRSGAATSRRGLRAQTILSRRRARPAIVTAATSRRRRRRA
jgi:hypothetical protein